MATEPVLGRLQVVPPRSVWAHEALDFTPWLLKNVDVLAEVLGMDLVLEAAEHPVGGFSLDLIGKDQATGRTVIVENQLETSDHTHLGQILTYAAGTDPTTIVWVNTGFRPEHRAAIDWLNERTSEDTRFFGIEIEVVRIGASDPAPAFKLVAQPNDWGKQVKAAAVAASGEVSTRERLYQDFWTLVRDRLVAAHPDWTKSTGTTKQAWFSMSAGIPGATWTLAFNSRCIAVILEFLDPDPDINAARFEALYARKTEFESAFGRPVTWEAKESVKSTRLVALGEKADVSDREAWDAWAGWLLATSEEMRAALTAVGGVPSLADG
jgi:hypothetical protein